MTKKRLLLTTLLVLLLLSTEGCLVATSGLIGGSLKVLPVTVSNYLFENSPLTVEFNEFKVQEFANGKPFANALYGIILSENSLNHDVALNPIPISEKEANTLKVSVSDLEDYNDHLNNILVLDSKINLKIQSLRNEKMSIIEQNAIASSLGFESVDSLTRAIDTRRIEFSILKNFSDVLQLPSQRLAQIYLKKKWGIETSDTP